MSDQEQKKVPYFPTSLTIFNDLSRLEVSLSAWVVLDYLIRHTKGWKNHRWVTLKLQDFIQGRPTPSGNRYDHGIPIKHPATVQAAIEELGVKGFILELDEGHKDGRVTYGLQDKYFTDDATEAARLTTTPKYRLIRKEDGKYYWKPDAEQQPHYYHVTFKPLQKLKNGPKRGKKSSIIEEETSTIEDPLQSLKRSVSIIEEPEGFGDSQEAGPEAVDIKSTENKIIDNRTDNSVAPAARSPKGSPPVDIEEKQEENKTIRDYEQRIAVLQEQMRWSNTPGKEQHEITRLQREIERIRNEEG